MSKTELEIHSTDSVQLYGAFVGGDDPGCQDYCKPFKLNGVRIVDEKWLLKLVAERDKLLAALGNIANLNPDSTARGPQAYASDAMFGAKVTGPSIAELQDAGHLQKPERRVVSTPIELDLDALVAAAEAASPGPEHIYTHPRDSNNCHANEWYHHNIYPEYVLELVRRLRAAEGLAAARIEQIPTDASMLAFFCDILPEHKPEAEALVMAIQKRCGPKTLVAFFREGDNDMKALDEAAMRAAGWVRADDDRPDALSVYFMHDCHLFTRLKGATLDEILAHADQIESGPDGSYGALCPITLLRNGKEVRRVGPMAHAIGADDPKDKWNEGKAKWRAAAEADPDVMRLLKP